MDDKGAERVADWWRRTPEARAATRRTNWLEHPRLLHYSARRVIGSRFGESWRWAVQSQHECPVDRLLSLGAGGGGRERRVAKHRLARRIEGIDVSAGAVEQAGSRDLGRLAVLEQRLEEEGRLASDFTVAVAVARSRP